MTELVELSRVGFRFDRSPMLFQDIDLHVGRGEIVGLIGANGAGKTTLLNLICGLLRPTQGSITFAGASDERLSRSLQRPVSIEGLHAWRYLVGTRAAAIRALRRPGGGVWAMVAEPLFAITPTGLAHRRQARGMARDAIENLGLDPRLADEPMDSLSTGQRRAVDVLRVLASRSAVLLLDEPFSGLRRDVAEALARRIRDTAGGERAALVVDHRVDTLRMVADRVYRLTSLGLVEAGPPAAGAAGA